MPQSPSSSRERALFSTARRWPALVLVLLSGCWDAGQAVAPAPLSAEEDRRLQEQDDAARSAEGAVPPDPSAARDPE